MVKKIACLAIALVLAVSVMLVPASAESISTTGTVIGVHGTSDISPSYAISQSITFPLAGVKRSLGASKTFAFGSITTDTETSYDSAVGFYVSFYFETYYPVTTYGSPTSGSAYSAHYYNSAGTQGTVVGGPSVSTFTPAVSSSKYSSPGITLKCQFEGSPELPIKGIFYNSDYTNNYFRTPDDSGTVYLHVSSAKIVEVGAGEDLAALEGIANEIANQSEILSAMYGDVMEVLNAIYQRTGSILEAQNLANSYFNSMVNYLNSINTNTANIYSLLQSQFQVLIATINTASSDIQGAISKQTEDLKTYFDSVFNSAVGTLPEDTNSAQGVIDDAHETDEEYTADALGKFEAISSAFNGFDGSLGSGVALASTLFSRVWTAMGEYVIIYTFPLMLAVALVAVGRLSRVHGGSKSKDGDSIE